MIQNIEERKRIFMEQLGVKTKANDHYNYLAMYATYKAPEVHSHLASHLIFSPKGHMICSIEKKEVNTEAIFISSGAEHTAYSEDKELLVFLFVEGSTISKEVESKFLKGKSYQIVPKELLSQLKRIYFLHNQEFDRLESQILESLQIGKKEDPIFESRIEEVLYTLRMVETIEANTLDLLCDQVGLSKSRLSHLFKEEVGVTIKQYLALEKMRKLYCYFQEQNSITEASLKAGFYSSSHGAATCKKMFGISLSMYQAAQRGSK